MVETYDDADDDAVRAYRRIHANGEQTRVVIVNVAGRDYAAVAYDIRPSDFSPLAAETIAYDPTLEGVTERAERWMQEHPKGVMQAQGGSDESDGGGALATVKKAAGKLNDYGNDLREQQQQYQQTTQTPSENDNE